MPQQIDEGLLIRIQDVKAEFVVLIICPIPILFIKILFQKHLMIELQL
jgi:hypothetical protein